MCVLYTDKALLLRGLLSPDGLGLFQVVQTGQRRCVSPLPEEFGDTPQTVGGGVRIHPENARMSGRHGVQYVAQCVACAALTLVVWQ